MTSTATGGFDNRVEQGEPPRRNGMCRSKKPWSLWEIAAMVGGFVVWWPLGLLALFMKLTRGEMWPGATEKAPWESFNLKAPDITKWTSPGSGLSGQGSGNAAFDAYRRETLKRLDEERRKLDDEQRSFRDFVDRLRRAKDQDEFDRFMKERKMQDDPPPANG